MTMREGCRRRSSVMATVWTLLGRVRRHHCPHLPTKIFDKTEKPCLLSEYTENYPLYHSYLPRDSFKPKLAYQKGSIPMEGLTTSRRDFGPHKVLPVKIHQPDHFVPSKENMDLLTTYKQDYNPYPLCRVDPIKPRDSKYPCGDKMECLPTYKADYLPWNQPRRELLRPERKYWPESTRFDSRTTHQDDYSVKGLVSTMSCKPPVMPKVCNIPLEDLTNYKMSYVAHPLEKRFVHEAEKFRACEIPFESLTTHKQSYRGLKGEPAKSLKPPARSCGLDTPFSNTTEFQDKFQAWPTPQVFCKPPAPYAPPEEKMDLLTTVQSHYTYPKGAPAQSCRPVLCVKKGGRFESSTTTKDDYKQWASMRTEPVKPIPQLNRPTEPLDCLTTTRAHYVPHPPINTKSYKPSWSGPRGSIPMEGQTTYTISFTPKEMGRCLASYPEPPGYIFEETDASGHRIYRPISQTCSRQNSPLSAGDSENPKQQELAVSA
ncbi:stabilizer of axonemal microtubules 1 [Phyllostomus discolor]|uniref:Stabilizer of axonemal microtubules 1 n=1 Tax=Phyllostomus discolor TaxID=89673 RepID=A0A7E6D9J5_9CHIR|nr:stabilizer of axonemal microtubules 1 [Phyllostomus discolor]KAF6127038.1 stabilizer of axonemal microtubules 1 [Phyllostomus discolor]